jgi:putrescine transport system ATP-binding protein
MALEVHNLTKMYGLQPVLNQLSLHLPMGETMSVLGQSGCGKTTLLKCIAGLVDANHGEVSLNGTDLSNVSPEKRGIVYLSQEPSLFPHLSVRDNVNFGLTLHVNKRSLKQTTSLDQMLDAVGMASFASKKPHQLSGGQKQRVAFGRALLIQPSVLLLDEPFGSLDSQTRTEMQSVYAELMATYKTTALFITHDLKEALTVGQRYALMSHGKLQQFASRAEFISEPDVRFDAERDFWKQFF